MEELLVLALLLCEEIITEDEYKKRLDDLFMDSPENDHLLYLEWETDIDKSITYIRSNIDYNSFDYELFGSLFMRMIRKYYKSCSELRSFAQKMYGLWENLPGHIQDKEPFHTLSYADDPLSWEDEEQTRNHYEKMMDYYFV